ncbi:MAG: GerMN domain-containing protein [Wujia sp.]
MKRFYCTLLALLVCLQLSGCELKKEKEEPVAALAENTFFLYHPTDNKVERVDQVYQLKTPDSITACVEEVMSALVTDAAGMYGFYKYMLDDDKNLSLELYLDRAYDKQAYLLMMASISKTILQIPDIKEVEILLYDSEDNVLKKQTFNRDCVYYYGYTDSVFNTVEFALYVPDTESKGLKIVNVSTQLRPQESVQEAILNALVQQDVLPAQTGLNAVWVHGDVCYMDVSSAFVNGECKVSEELRRQCLITSIKENVGVSSVEIMVDGKF